jgi:hypothetical protein
MVAQSGNPMLLAMPVASRKSNTIKDDGPAVQPAGRRLYYARRRPEETTLYQLVQEHRESFLAQLERETGAGLPEFVQEELDAFLQCGILAHGPLAPALRCLGPGEARGL